MPFKEKFVSGLKKVGAFCAGIASAFIGIAIAVFCHKGEKTATRGDNKLYEVEVDSDSIENEARKESLDVVRRIAGTSASALCENYSGVCDSISEGKERFLKRCAEREKDGEQQGNE